MVAYSCLALIEHETELLYETMVRKAGDRNLELLLNLILQETKGHEEIFKHLARLHDETYPPAVADCKAALGKVFAESVEFTKDLSSRVQNGMPLLDAMSKLAGYEGAVGEEYMTLVGSRLSTFDEEDSTIRKILLHIAKDEEGHKEILRQAIGAGSASTRQKRVTR